MSNNNEQNPNLIERALLRGSLSSSRSKLEDDNSTPVVYNRQLFPNNNSPAAALPNKKSTNSQELTVFISKKKDDKTRSVTGVQPGNEIELNYGGITFEPVRDPYKALMETNSVYINQKLDYRAIGCCEIVYEYVVVTKFADGPVNILFHLNEESSDCSKCCVQGSNRAMKLNFNELSYTHDQKMYSTPVRTYQKDSKCCYCLCPCGKVQEFKTTKIDGEPGTTVLSYPSNCCGDDKIYVHDDQGKVIYYLTSTTCNRCGGQCCGNYEILIYSANGSPDPVGKITKKTSCCGGGLLSNVEFFYDLIFPVKSNLEERIKLITAVVFFDFIYLEGKSNDNTGCCACNACDCSTKDCFSCYCCVFGCCSATRCCCMMLRLLMAIMR